jgi:hypothetical protein
MEGPGTARRAEVRRQVHVALQCVRALRTEEAEQEILPHIGVEWQVGEGVRHIADPHEPVSGKEPRDLIEGIEGEPKACHVGGRVDSGAGMIACRAPLQLVRGLTRKKRLRDGPHREDA